MASEGLWDIPSAVNCTTWELTTEGVSHDALRSHGLSNFVAHFASLSSLHA